LSSQKLLGVAVISGFYIQQKKESKEKRTGSRLGVFFPTIYTF